MATPASELGWVVHFAPVVRFTPLSPTYWCIHYVKITKFSKPAFCEINIVLVASAWKAYGGYGRHYRCAHARARVCVCVCADQPACDQIGL